MSRLVSNAGNYETSAGSRLPVRWTAPEVLQQQPSTFKSDVWSFGIVMWEIFGFGLEPYVGMSNLEVLDFLTEGHRLEKPKSCPDQMYSLMWVMFSI